MPLYEYQCDSCQTVTERIQKFSDPPLTACPACGGPVRKLLSSPAIQFKGSGWYITDYARKSSNGKSASGGDAAETRDSSATPEKKQAGAPTGTPSESASRPGKSDS